MTPDCKLVAMTRQRGIVFSFAVQRINCDQDLRKPQEVIPQNQILKDTYNTEFDFFIQETHAVNSLTLLTEVSLISFIPSAIT